MRAHRLLLVLVAFCLTMPAAARGQDVLTEVSAKRMTKILSSMGLEVQETKTTSDGRNPVIRFELGGYRVLMFLASDLTDAQLYVGFRERKIAPETMNEWNRDHRFSRAYRDKDGDSVLESDIDFTGGVTEANIKSWVRIFRNATGEYSKFLNTMAVSDRS